MLSRIDPVHALKFHFLKIYLNIILPSTPGSLSGLFPLRFPHQDLVNTSVVPRTCYTPRLSPSRFDHPNNIGWGVQIIKLLIMYFLRCPVTSSLLRPNILLSTLFSSTLSLRCSFNEGETSKCIYYSPNQREILNPYYGLLSTLKHEVVVFCVILVPACAELHGVTFRKTALKVLTAMITSSRS